MSLVSQCLEVLAQYPGDFRPHQVEPLGSAGGFSGGTICRVKTAHRVLCLKRWPRESSSGDTLRFIHAVLYHVARQGFDRLPVPYKNRIGQTFVSRGSDLWELAPWLPGKADFRLDPRPERLRAAMTVLAEFHQAAASYGDEGRLPKSARLWKSGASPGVRERLQHVRQYAAGDLDQLARCLVPDVWPELCERAWQAIGCARLCLEPVRRLLETAAPVEVPLQPCIRDVWHDHVLFTGDRVTGLVDFGAMRVESVAGDVARLLGSLAGDNHSLWSIGLEAYASVRPLSDAEQSLVSAFDQSGVVLAALNWIEWLYRQRREFPDAAAVSRRLDEVLPRLQVLAALPPAEAATPSRPWFPRFV